MLEKKGKAKKAKGTDGQKHPITLRDKQSLFQKKAHILGGKVFKRQRGGEKRGKRKREDTTKSWCSEGGGILPKDEEVAGLVQDWQQKGWIREGGRGVIESATANEPDSGRAAYTRRESVAGRGTKAKESSKKVRRGNAEGVSIFIDKTVPDNGGKEMGEGAR